jgi:predicted transport protein
VHVRHFHKWCRDQLVAFGQTLPAQGMAVEAKMEEMVMRVIHGVDRKHIPSGQYQTVLIDEGHDFAPEWLKLVTQMVDPATNSLLLYLHVDPATALLVLPNARDVTSIGHWGTGNLEVPLTSQADLDAVKPFINAAYEGRS